MSYVLEFIGLLLFFNVYSTHKAWKGNKIIDEREAIQFTWLNKSITVTSLMSLVTGSYKISSVDYSINLERFFICLNRYYNALMTKSEQPPFGTHRTGSCNSKAALWKTREVSSIGT